MQSPDPLREAYSGNGGVVSVCVGVDMLDIVAAAPDGKPGVLRVEVDPRSAADGLTSRLSRPTTYCGWASLAPVFNPAW